MPLIIVRINNKVCALLSCDLKAESTYTYSIYTYIYLHMYILICTYSVQWLFAIKSCQTKCATQNNKIKRNPVESLLVKS